MLHKIQYNLNRMQRSLISELFSMSLWLLLRRNNAFGRHTRKPRAMILTAPKALEGYRGLGGLRTWGCYDNLGGLGSQGGLEAQGDPERQGTGIQEDPEIQRDPVTHNLGQNISNKVKRSIKIGPGKAALASTFGWLLTPIAGVYFLEGRLGAGLHSYLTFLNYFLIS